MELSQVHKIYFFGFAVLTIFGIIIGAYPLYPNPMPDEYVYYKPLVDDWNKNGIGVIPSHYDTKPFYFLYIEKILDADPVKTRTLNLFLIIVVTALLYKLTEKKESLLFILIPITLLSMWLTVEIFEVLFLILAFNYPSKSGWFIGLATLFRPYSALFFLLLDKRQKINYLVIVAIGISILIYLGLFFPYITRLFHYGTNERIWDEIGVWEPLVLIIFLLIGFNTKTRVLTNSKLWYWQILAIIPLYFKLYGHYFLTPISLLFLGFLLNQNNHKNTQTVHSFKYERDKLIS